MKLCIVGGGWAGLAAGVAATQAGHQVTLHEATHHLGGRARAVNITLPDGGHYTADNGQHILIGAYTDTLRLMQTVGINEEDALLRLPLTMLFPDGRGMALPRWPSPLDALGGILTVRGWSAADKWSLVRYATRWQWQGFTCAAQTSVADLCAGLSPTVMQTLIEPLCVSALNTPVSRSSGQVFLRVLKDALLGGSGSSNLLIPKVDLSALFPEAAARWLQANGAKVCMGSRVTALVPGAHWQVVTQAPSTVGQHGNASDASGGNPESFDAVLWATSSSVAAQTMRYLVGPLGGTAQAWADTAAALQFEAICTVYALCRPSTQATLPLSTLPQPMLALHSSPQEPAQFVFDRAHFGGPAGLLAFVVSASATERDVLNHQVLQQSENQLAHYLQGATLQPLQTIVEKRATFACTPGLKRPPMQIAPGLLACGDYVEGPYPATLEGAVRSALQAVQALPYH